MNVIAFDFYDKERQAPIQMKLNKKYVKKGEIFKRDDVSYKVIKVFNKKDIEMKCVEIKMVAYKIKNFRNRLFIRLEWYFLKGYLVRSAKFDFANVKSGEIAKADSNACLAISLFPTSILTRPFKFNTATFIGYSFDTLFSSEKTTLVLSISEFSNKKSILTLHSAYFFKSYCKNAILYNELRLLESIYNFS